MKNLEIPNVANRSEEGMPQYPPQDKTLEKKKFNEAINEND
jgi:hypothetical protein